MPPGLIAKRGWSNWQQPRQPATQCRCTPSPTAQAIILQQAGDAHFMKEIKGKIGNDQNSPQQRIERTRPYKSRQ